MINLVVVIIIVILFSTIWLLTRKTEVENNAAIQTIIDGINKRETPAVQTIPKIIIQVWVERFGGSPKIPAEQIAYMKKMRDLNPSFQYLFFDGKDVADFFESNYPEYYDTYKRLPAFIQKLDFFRYLAIYHYGGFYFDCDVEPHKPLDAAILNHQVVFPVDEFANSGTCTKARMKDTCSRGVPFLMGQYGFGAVAGHPFFKYVVDKIRRNLDTYVKDAKRIENDSADVAHYFVYKTTGPDFITDCYNSYGHQDQFYILSNGKRQSFGNYATHRYAGTWK